mgnify:CR=1 FL=1
MAKIKVSADTILSILQGIMNDEDINYTITDVSAPEDWKGKTVQEALNVKYYTFKHRPYDTELVIRDILKKGGNASVLESTNRAFCILSLGSTDRVFSNKIDNVTVSANLEYWAQTDKVKLLEDMFEDIAIETNGIRVPVQIGSEERQVLIAVGALNIGELEDSTEFGEMSVCEITIDFVFYENSVSMTDYEIEFLDSNAEEGAEIWIKLPFSNISISSDMTQKAVPYVNNTRNVGNINLSRVKSFVIGFEGYENTFIDNLVTKTLESDISISSSESEDTNNNEQVVMRLTRKNDIFTYDCIIKSHSISVQEDTRNEIHSLTLTTRGIKYGTA